MQGTEGTEAEDDEKPLPLLLSIKALQAAWQAASANIVNSRAADVGSALREALQPGKKSVNN